MSTRRQFLTRAGSAGAAVVLMPQALTPSAFAHPRKARKLLHGGHFSQGVQGGPPPPHGITLSTIVDDVGGWGGVRLGVARDSGFGRLRAPGVIPPGTSHNHAVKARVH